MFYKKENEIWWCAQVIALPSGVILNPGNKESIDGWQWYDTEPIEFTIWKIKQENNS
jgi:hypothetical protein